MRPAQEKPVAPNIAAALKTGADKDAAVAAAKVLNLLSVFPSRNEFANEQVLVAVQGDPPPHCRHESRQPLSVPVSGFSAGRYAPLGCVLLGSPWGAVGEVWFLVRP